MKLEIFFVVILTLIPFLYTSNSAGYSTDLDQILTAPVNSRLRQSSMERIVFGENLSVNCEEITGDWAVSFQGTSCHETLGCRDISGENIPFFLELISVDGSSFRGTSGSRQFPGEIIHHLSGEIFSNREVSGTIHFGTIRPCDETRTESDLVFKGELSDNCSAMNLVLDGTWPWHSLNQCVGLGNHSFSGQAIAIKECRSVNLDIVQIRLDGAERNYQSAYETLDIIISIEDELLQSFFENLPVAATVLADFMNCLTTPPPIPPPLPAILKIAECFATSLSVPLFEELITTLKINLKIIRGIRLVEFDLAQANDWVRLAREQFDSLPVSCGESDQYNQIDTTLREIQIKIDKLQLGINNIKMMTGIDR